MDMDLVPKLLMKVAIKAVAGSVSIQLRFESGIKNAKSHARNAELFSDNPANVSYNEYQFVIVQARSDVSSKKCIP